MPTENLTKKFAKPTAFDKARYLKEFASAFASAPQYNAGAAQNSLALLQAMEKDGDITDIRWIAYMMATTLWETTALKEFDRKKTVGKGKVVTVKVHKWVYTMEPVDEIGKGKKRRYHEPAKVKLLPDGGARITEIDGDQFFVRADGYGCGCLKVETNSERQVVRIASSFAKSLPACQPAGRTRSSRSPITR